MTSSVAEVVAPTEEGLLAAVAALRRGALVGLPTETVYGLAARVFDPDAVAAVFAAKERPLFDPLIVHVAPPMTSEHGGVDGVDSSPWAAIAALVDAEALTPERRSTADALMRRFWPGPLTLVLPKRPVVHDLVTAGLPSVAVRMPAHPVAIALLRALGEPICAPSANRFGRISPTSPQDVISELGDRVALVLDGGLCEVGVESTVVAVDGGGRIRLLRPGGVPREALAEVARVTMATGANEGSPGTSPSHYAPGTPLELIAPNLAGGLATRAMTEGKVAVLASTEATLAAALAWLVDQGIAVVAGEALSATDDATEAARNLFRCLRRLDDAGAEVILAEPWPGVDGQGADEGLGHAINDRLHRAAARPNV